ncbi:MAG: hypothetical protein ACK4V1_00835 [Burkholderiaceae bacterium]
MSGHEGTALWRHARVRRAASWSAALLAAAAAAVAAGWWLHAQARARAEVLAQRLDAQRAELQTLSAFGTPAVAIDAYRALRERGFLGAPDAVALIESVHAAAARLRLPPPAYELRPHQPAGAKPEAAPGDGLRQFDLKLTLAGIHEQEALALLAALQELRHGVLQPRRCALLRRTDAPGLSFECTLRWSVLAGTRENAS